MIDVDLKKRIRFFAENAGYALPPGRMACAKALALAEVEACKRGWVFEWSEDWDADTSWMDDDAACWRKSDRERSYFLQCLLRERDEDGTILASLCGIHFLRGGPANTEHRKTYGRVVEAELAWQALDEEKRTRQEDARAIAACAL